MDKKPIDEKMVAALVEAYHKIAQKYCPSCWAVKLCPKCFSHVKRGTMTEKNFLEYCEKFKGSVLKSLELFVTIKEKDEKAFDDIKFLDASDINSKREELLKK